MEGLEGTDKSLFRAIELILGKTTRLDARLIEENIEYLASILDDTKALERFFAVDPQDLKDALEHRKAPKNFTTKRYLNILQGLKSVIDALHSGEAHRVEQFLKDMKLTKKQEEALLRSSMFMNPSITERFLTQALKTKHHKVSLSERIWDFTQLPKNTLLDIVRSGVAEGKNPKVIQATIRKQLRDQSDYNIKRMVVTESRRVWQEVQKEAYSEFKHIGGVKLKLSPKHVKKDVCDDWKAKGVIPLEECPGVLHPNSRSIWQAVPMGKEEWLQKMNFADKT